MMEGGRCSASCCCLFVSSVDFSNCSFKSFDWFDGSLTMIRLISEWATEFVVEVVVVGVLLLVVVDEELELITSNFF